ncbi:hypothetical protein PMAYCL1PPCAC_19282, partial [Pristionchus mayeri]
EDEYDVYKAQILERQRLEAEQEERERREEERIERVRREKEEARKREEERRAEEERKREEDREKSAQAVLDAMERAKKEAEMLKKMRLHRHALEADGGATLPIDGVDRRRVEEMKREVDALERQKRLEAEEIARNAPPKEKKRGMVRRGSLARSPSISAHYESSVGRGGGTTSDESSRSRTAAPPAAAAAAAPSSPFRRAASLAPASAAARRTQQAASAAAAAVSPPPRQPLAASTPLKQQVQQQQPKSPFEFSLRGTPSPQGITSRYAHLNQSPAPSSRGSTTSSSTHHPPPPGRSPSVGRPPIAPPRTRTQMNCTPSMPSRDSPLSRTFHAGDKTRQSMKENARSSGYGIGGNWLYSYSPSASRCVTPDRMGWNSSGRNDATPEPQQQRRGREEERRGREYREDRDYDEGGGSSPRSNDTFITSPTVTATSRVEEPLIRYSVPRKRVEEYGSRPSSDYGRPRSSSVRHSSRQDDVDDYGRRSNVSDHSHVISPIRERGYSKESTADSGATTAHPSAPAHLGHLGYEPAVLAHLYSFTQDAHIEQGHAHLQTREQHGVVGDEQRQRRQQWK